MPSPLLREVGRIECTHAKPKGIRGVANALSISRLVAGVALLVAAWLGATHVVLGLLLYALLTDAIDGQVARAFGTVSEQGAQLDSVADCVIYLTMPCVAWLLFPVIRERETASCVLMFLAYAIPLASGFCLVVKRGRRSIRLSRNRSTATCALPITPTEMVFRPRSST
jgi:phosphatidylglycerophosphate synthase